MNGTCAPYVFFLCPAPSRRARLLALARAAGFDAARGFAGWRFGAFAGRARAGLRGERGLAAATGLVSALAIVADGSW